MRWTSAKIQIEGEAGTGGTEVSAGLTPSELRCDDLKGEPKLGNGRYGIHSRSQAELLASCASAKLLNRYAT
jgi:hypothetical protein